jgi:multiple sugar transport system ATP-binding protein
MITVAPHPDRVHLFDFESGERIGTLQARHLVP